MKSFVDTANRTWTIQMTVDAVKRVKNLVGVNLLDIGGGDPPLLTRFGTDIMILCDVIYALIKPQADALGVTDEQFGASLGGEGILGAQSAFYEELISFFQGMGRKDLMKAVLAQRNLIEKAVQKVAIQIDLLNMDQVIEETFGKLSTNSQE